MEDKDKAIHDAFEKLRPLCVQLTKEHTRGNVAKVKDALDGLSQIALQQLQQYVMFPLRLILKQSPSSCQDLYIDVLQCMHDLLMRTEVVSPEMFQDLFSSLCLTISSPNTQNKVQDLPEEVKLEVIKCLSALADRASSGVLESIYTPPFLPPLGHAVSVLLHLLQTERYRQLRVESLKCLMHLAQVDKKVGHSFKVTVGDMFASFLPGVTLGVAKVITGDVKQGQVITVTAIEAWSKIVCLVVGDQYLETASQTRHKEMKLDEKLSSLLVKRTPEWVVMTTEKLKVLVERIIAVVTHSNWRVRLALVEWAESLLLKCTKSMQSCIPHFLEVLVTLVGDEYSNVGTRCKTALQKFQTSHLEHDTKPLVEILEENLHALATKLPRLVRCADDGEKLGKLRLFSGYLKLLGPQLNSLLHSYSHLQRVTLALMQVLELDCSHVRILQERRTGLALTSLESDSVHQRPRKYFKHFVDENIFQEIVIICRLLGYYGDLQLLVDHMMDIFHQTCLHRKQAAMVVNEVILGVTREGLDVDMPTKQNCSADQLQHLLGGLIQEYLSPEYFNLLTSNQSDISYHHSKAPDWQIVSANRKHPNSIEEMNSSAWLICLLLEGIGNCAKVLKVEGFQYSLMHVLYPVLEKLGDENVIVSETAYMTLVDICQACDYSSMQDLLCKNADYLVNSISLKLRHVTRHPLAPRVLQVVIIYSHREILPLIDDVIYEVLSTLDQYHSDRAVQFMQVLATLVSAIKTWFPPDTKQESQSRATEQVENTSQDLDKAQKEESFATAKRIHTFLMEYERQKRIAEGDFSDEELANEEENIAEDAEVDDGGDEGIDEQKKDPPKHIQIVMQIMERCTHLVSAADPRLRLLVLDVTAEACIAMSQNYDELLPLIHKVWPPFALRFQDEELLVVTKAFHTLCVIAETCGDFLRQRIVKDILPKINSYLDKQALVSQKAGPAYRHTNHCKLQLAILQGIGTVCRKTDIGGHQLTPVVTSCTPYLSSRQPMVLQEACREAFQEFSRIDSDSVWLTVNALYCAKPLRPLSHSAFEEIKGLSSHTRNEFSDNVSAVLEQLVD